MRALRVLVVEDGEETSSLVRKLGHVPMHVATSVSAHHKTAAWNPDLVLVDLTRFDGVKLARQLRSDTHIPKMALIGITAFMDLGQRQTAIDAGFDEFLAMPYKPSELEGILLRVESRIAESKAITERTRAIAELSRKRNRKSREGLDGQPG
jgi:CheY-like chemotaxis protein